VQDILAHQLEEEIKQKYQLQLADDKRRLIWNRKSYQRQKKNLSKLENKRPNYSKSALRASLKMSEKPLKKN
jgi:hypothetical protein